MSDRPGAAIGTEDAPLRRSLFADPAKLWIIGGFVCTAYLLSTVVIGFVNAETVPNDYLSFWSAGELVLDGEAEGVYDRRVHHEQSEAITGDRPLDNLPFLLPPTFLFLSVAVAWVGYLPGLALLTSVGVAVVAWLAWRLTQEWLPVLLVLAAPTTLVNTQLGQLGMVFAGAATTALLDCQRHPWRSGLGLAVLSVKPQLGVGVGLALLAARAWRALFAGVAFSLLMVASSVVAFGSDRWSEFIDGLSLVGPLVDEAGWANQGLYGLLTSQAVPVPLAAALQCLLVVAVGVPVLARVRHHGLTGPVVAMVLCLSALISPRSYAYDYEILVPAAVLLVINRDGLGRTEPTTRWTILCSVVLGFAALGGLPTMPLAALTLLWFARTFSASGHSR